MNQCVIGWDIGGAHVKAVMLDAQGHIVRVSQQACALWKGLHLLEAALKEILQQWQLQPAECAHAVTMTGELVDLFEHRIQGVQAIAETVLKYMPNAVFYMATPDRGAEFTATVSGHETGIASMNWHASAQCLAMRNATAMLVVDIGSTTTDITLCEKQQVIASGWTDAARMRQHGLFYSGVVRTPLMALGPYIEWQAQVQHIAAEYFATTADVYRVLGELSPQYDLADTADGQSRSISASMRRLARMVGHDLEDVETQIWHSLAQAFRQRQITCLLQAIQSNLVQHHVPVSAITGLGAGSFLLPELAQALNLPYIPASSWMAATQPKLKDDAEVCFPAYAVARLCQTWH